MPNRHGRALRRADLPAALFTALVAVLVVGAGTGLALGSPRTVPDVTGEGGLGGDPDRTSVAGAPPASGAADDADRDPSDLSHADADAELIAHLERDLGDWNVAIGPRGTIAVPVWFVASEQGRLTLAPEPVDAAALLGDAVAVSRLELARVAMELALTALPNDPTMATGAPEGAHVRRVELDGDVLIIDVSSRLAAVTGTRVREEALAQQLAHTALDVVGARGIRLRIDGRDVTRLWGHVDWSRPVTVHGLPIELVTAESACQRALVVAPDA